MSDSYEAVRGANISLAYLKLMSLLRRTQAVQILEHLSTISTNGVQLRFTTPMGNLGAGEIDPKAPNFRPRIPENKVKEFLLFSRAPVDIT